MKPFVSVIIVNYNGSHLMDDCLSSLLKIQYPKSRFEAIVVDNGSKDGSQNYIKKNYPAIKLIEANANLGFTGGNNLGLEHAKGEYIVLLNSDTKVDKNWLSTLTSTAENNPHVGLINSKLLFHIPYIEISIHSTITRKSNLESRPDHSPIGILVEDIIPEDKNLNDLIWYADGFYERNDGGPKNIRWTKGDGRVLLPIKQQKGQTFKITLHGLPSYYALNTPIKITSNGKILVNEILQSNEVKQYELKIKPRKKDLIWFVQNAGNLILHNGYSKDIGNITRNNLEGISEFYEEDNSFFNKQQEILAVCGASCLIKREVIDELKFLDGNYFMYYEDVDFSLRAWRMGWDILYEPKSIVYHKHRATTGKNISGFFLRMTERNHLSFVFTHFPLKTYISELCRFCRRLLCTMLRERIYQFSPNLEKRRQWGELAGGRKSAAKDVLSNFSNSFKNRLHWRLKQKRTFKQMQKFMY